MDKKMAIMLNVMEVITELRERENSNWVNALESRCSKTNGAEGDTLK